MTYLNPISYKLTSRRCHFDSFFVKTTQPRRVTKQHHPTSNPMLTYRHSNPNPFTLRWFRLLLFRCDPSRAAMETTRSREKWNPIPKIQLSPWQQQITAQQRSAPLFDMCHRVHSAVERLVAPCPLRPFGSFFIYFCFESFPSIFCLLLFAC